MEDRNVDNFLINKTDRKTINNIFLSAFFYPHIKNLNFVTFHNRQMWGVNSNIVGTFSFFFMISIFSVNLSNFLII